MKNGLAVYVPRETISLQINALLAIPIKNLQKLHSIVLGRSQTLIMIRLHHSLRKSRTILFPSKERG